tara:strand:- start:120 stop:239 length:120 start_codon:yes stop_codon:yes gene_type:complete
MPAKKNVIITARKQKITDKNMPWKILGLLTSVAGRVDDR